MKIVRLPALSALLAVMALAVPALAHGWVFVPTPTGLGTQEFAGPVGLGADPGDEVAVGHGDGQSEVTPTPDAPAKPVTRSTPRRTVTDRVPSRLDGAKAAFGRATTGNRPKAQLAPWRRELAIPWKAAFPVPTGNGYDGHRGLDAGLTTSPEEGGWVRDERPSLVVIYDASNEDHQRAVRQLELDHRFLVAANLFNCFRAEASTFGEPTTDVQVRTYTSKGVLAGKASGQRKLRGAFDALEAAWLADCGASLAKTLPKATALVEAVAKTAHDINVCEHAVVCPDCGEERHDIRETLAVLRRHEQSYRTALSTLK